MVVPKNVTDADDTLADTDVKIGSPAGHTSQLHPLPDGHYLVPVRGACVPPVQLDLVILHLVVE